MPLTPATVSLLSASITAIRDQAWNRSFDPRTLRSSLDAYGRELANLGVPCGELLRLTDLLERAPVGQLHHPSVAEAAIAQLTRHDLLPADEEATRSFVERLDTRRNGPRLEGFCRLARLFQRKAEPRSFQSPLPPTSARLRIPRYELQTLLGNGYSGAVYKARDIENGNAVAVKVCRPDRASRNYILAGLVNELRFQGRDDLSKVVRVTSTGRTSGGLPYVAMEYRDGGNLEEWERAHGAKRNRKGKAASTMLRQCLEAVAELHRHGIVHRDIKGSCFLLSTDGSVKVSDLGMAVREKERMRSTRCGTPGYIAPEAMRESGEEKTRRDVYSLGVVLLEFVTGTYAYEDYASRVADLIERSPLERLKPLLRRATAEDPRARYADAGEVLEAFNRAFPTK